MRGCAKCCHLAFIYEARQEMKRRLDSVKRTNAAPETSMRETRMQCTHTFQALRCSHSETSKRTRGGLHEQMG